MHSSSRRHLGAHAVCGIRVLLYDGYTFCRAPAHESVTKWIDFKLSSTRLDVTHRRDRSWRCDLPRLHLRGMCDELKPSPDEAQNYKIASRDTVRRTAPCMHALHACKYFSCHSHTDFHGTLQRVHVLCANEVQGRLTQCNHPSAKAKRCILTIFPQCVNAVCACVCVTPCACGSLPKGWCCRSRADKG